jgi:hypothetical protein
MDIATAQSMVLETLQRAANQNAEILKPAELKLKEWETEPGFYSILLVCNKYFSFFRNVESFATDKVDGFRAGTANHVCPLVPWCHQVGLWMPVRI